MDLLRIRNPAKGNRKKAMERGTAFHEAAAAYLLNNRTSVVLDAEANEWLEKLQLAWPRSEHPQRIFAEQAVGLSQDARFISVEETEPHVYKATSVFDEGRLLTAGRADAIWGDEGIVSVLDFKTGKTHLGPPELLPQLQALGLAAADMLKCDVMRLGIYYAREAVFEWSPDIAIDSPLAASMWEQVKLFAGLDENPRFGKWCEGCFEKRGCGPYQEQKKGTVENVVTG